MTLKYKTKNEWIKACPREYKYASKYDLLDSLYKEAGWPSRKSWTKEECLEDAMNYERKVDWQQSKGGGYTAALRKGWLDECCGHMVILNKTWTKELCLEDALKYNSKSDWQKSKGGGYQAAKRNGWLEECCGHMVIFQKPNGYWTKELCIVDALKYERKVDWDKSKGSGYQAAIKYGWYDECTVHMILGNKSWTKELCLEDALKYNTRGEWKKSKGSGYQSARKYDWLDECTEHMKKLKK